MWIASSLKGCVRMIVDKFQRTRAMRYKRPALASMGYEHLKRELEEIAEACDDVAWYTSQNNEDDLVAALDGNGEEAFEFKMMFGDLSARCNLLRERLYDLAEWDEDGAARTYDDCTVALIGNRYDTVGFDSMEEDYYSLTSYDEGLAYSEAGKRLMRHTKAEMLSIIGQSVGILVAFLDLRQQYDYVKATMDVLRDGNQSILQAVKELEKAYDEAADAHFNGPAGERFEQLLWPVPERMWVE